MITEKKLLSDCGTKLIIDDNPNDLYTIEIGAKGFLILQMGGGIHKAISRFTHPNIIYSRKEIYELKHYRKGGSKFWTSQAGVSHYLIIPTDKIYLLPEKGYSWIPAEINGVKVHFNVSGGSGGGWTDYLRSSTSTSINHKVADIKKIAEVAVRDVESMKLILALEEKDKDSIERSNELLQWAKMAEKASPNVKKNKEKLLKMIEEKVEVAIFLNDGYVDKVGNAVEVIRKGKKIKLSDDSWEWNMKQGRIRNLIVHFDGCFPKRVKNSQINWVKTVKENAELLERHAIILDNAIAV